MKLHPHRTPQTFFKSIPPIRWASYLYLFSVSILLLTVSATRTFQPSISPTSTKTPVQTEVSNQILGYYSPRVSITSPSDQYSNSDLITITSSDEPAIRVQPANYSGKVDIKLYQATLQDVLSFLSHDTEGKRLWLPKPDLSQLIQQFTETISTSEDKNILLPLSPTGIYLIQTQIPEVTEYTYLVRSNTAVLAKESDNLIMYWGQDLTSLRSINNGNLQVYQLENGVSQLYTSGFGNDGLTNTPLNAQADLAVITRSNDTAIVPLNLRYTGFNNSEYFRSQPRQIRYFVFTDRPLYRPGDTIYYKAILRDDNDAIYSLPNGSATVNIYAGSPYNEDPPITTQTYAISSGSLDGEFELPTDATTGYYTLTVEVPDTRVSYNYDSWYGSGEFTQTSFQVEHFRKPEYTIDIEVPFTEYIATDAVPVTVTGSYFSGQPITDGNVSYSIYKAPYYEYDNYTYYQAQLNDDYRYGSWGGSDVFKGNADFDQQGKANIQIPSELTSNNTNSQVYTITATYQDRTGNPVLARKNILVRSGEFGIYRTDFNYSQPKNQFITLPLKLTSNTQTNISNIQLTTNITHEKWVKEPKTLTPEQEEQAKYGKISRYTYRKVTRTFQPQTATTNASGEATFTLQPDEAGSYQFQVTTQDTRGNTLTKDFSIWVYEGGSITYFNDQEPGITITSSQSSYAPGDTAIFTITSQLPNRDILFSMDRGYMHDYQVVSLNSSVQTLEIPIDSTHMPNIFPSVSTFSRTTFDNSLLDLPISTNSQKIQVDIQANESQYGPSDTAELTIQTTDLQGNPISAETAVWAVDKAIFELASDRTQDIFRTYWSNRYNHTQTAHSLLDISDYGAEKGGGCFLPDTPILMADGTTKPISQVKIGDTVLTRASHANPQLVSSQVTNTFTHQVPGYMIINETLKVTPEHLLFINGSWQPAANLQIGDNLLDAQDEPLNVYSIEWLKQPVKVHNLTIANYHTYIAGNVWVHNSKGDARDTFEDTAYWNPRVQTNANGIATIRVPLPDNLTTWVVAAVAANAQTQVGQGTKEILVTKDIIVRPALPSLLRTGDQATLSASVHNFTDQPHTFNVSLDFDDGIVTPAIHSAIPIAANSSQTLEWHVQPQTVNPQAKLTFSAIATDTEDKADTIISTLPIEPYGYSDKTASTGVGDTQYTLSIASDADPQQSSIELHLTSSLVGTSIPAMEYLIRYPYGCVEQTTSRFVPAVIASRYPELFGDTLEEKDLEAMTQAGITRLIDLQNTDGGWNWWSGTSDPYITAYVTEYLILAQEAGIEINPLPLDNARQYFASLPQGNGDNLIIGNYINTLLYPDITTGKVIPTTDSTPTDLLAMALMANLHNQHLDPMSNGLSNLINQAQTDTIGTYWDSTTLGRFGSRHASTSIAIRALIQAEADPQLIASAVEYLNGTRERDYWSNTFATVQVLRALVEYGQIEQELSPSYTYEVAIGGETFITGTTAGRPLTRTIEIPTDQITDQTQISLTQQGTGQLYSTLVVDQFRTDPQVAARDNGFTISKRYTSEQGSNKSLTPGDLVTVELIISGLTSPTQYALIEDHLPSGLIPVNTNLKNAEYTRTTRDYRYGTETEFLPDGVNIFLRNVPAHTYKHTYQARVITAGTYLVPPATVSLMYRPDISGRSPAGSIEITDDIQTINPKLHQFGEIKESPITLRNILNAPQTGDRKVINLIIASFLIPIGLIFLGVGLYIRRHRQNKTSQNPSSKK